MAAVTRSPSSASSSPSSIPQRKPLPANALTIDSGLRWDDAQNGIAKPLPTVPRPLDSPRLRLPPASPVRLNLQLEDWPMPGSASIETAGGPTGPTSPSGPTIRPVEDSGTIGMALPAQPPPPPIDRALPKTPDPPSPPPHTPMHERPAYQSMAPPAPPSSAANRSAPSRHGLIDVPIPQQGSLLSPNAHAGLDFGFNQPQQEGPLSPEADSFSPEASVADDPNRHSRDTDTSGSSQQQASTNSSATTSASSVSGLNEVADSQENSTDSPESSVIDGSVSLPRNQSVPQLQYHHHHHPTFPLRSPSSAFEGDARAQSNPDLVDGVGMGNHLTPNSTLGISRRSSLPRPASAYSAYSDLGPRGRSPGLFGGSQNRAPSVQSRRSPENRTGSYAELLNVPYPQPAPAPINFDNSHLRHAVGTNASLLSTQKTLEMYRQNVKKTNDFGIQYSFAVFLIATAQEMGLNFEGGSSKGKTSPKQTRDTDSPYVEGSGSTPNDLIKEARNILQRLANAGYPFAQYYLADGYASGLFSKGKEDYNAAFPLFVLAAKHGHAESAYRAGLCYEFGWGCRVDPAKAIQFLRTAGSKGHPGAMTRLGKACLSGDLGEKRYKEAIKWLRLATECADTMYNAAPYILGCLYETGYGDDIFRDESYAAELFTQAAELGHPEANYRMGDAYEHGKLNCPRDPALSVHFYTGAAERGHPAAMMGLCAWYMVGADPILEKDEEEAYEWARRSAELGYHKAEYAVGYFTEMGIGCRRDILEANVWYVKAADAGDERAKQRLAAIRAAVNGGAATDAAAPRSKVTKALTGKDDKECVVM